MFLQRGELTPGMGQCGCGPLSSVGGLDKCQSFLDPTFTAGPHSCYSDLCEDHQKAILLCPCRPKVGAWPELSKGRRQPHAVQAWGLLQEQLSGKPGGLWATGSPPGST